MPNKPFVIDRVSVSSNGIEGNGPSVIPSLSWGGRYVAFFSAASDLVVGDGNDAYDVFVHDRKLGTTERVSISSDGMEGDLTSFNASISDDGRYVTFYSEATNLVPGDDNNVPDVFVHDRKKDTTILISRAADGTLGNGESSEPAISGNGKHVAFTSLASNLVPGDGNGSLDSFVASRYDWLV